MERRVLLDYKRHKFELKLIERYNNVDTIEQYCSTQLHHFVSYVLFADGEFLVLDESFNWISSSTGVGISDVCKIIKLYAKRCNISNMGPELFDKIIKKFISHMGRAVPLNTITQYGFHPDDKLFNAIIHSYIGLSVHNFKTFCENYLPSSTFLCMGSIFKYLRMSGVNNLKEYVKIIRTAKIIDYSPNKALLLAVLEIHHFGLEVVKTIIKTLNNEELSCVYNGRENHVLGHALHILQSSSLRGLRYEIVKLFIKHGIDIKNNWTCSIGTDLNDLNDDPRLYIMLVESGINVNSIFSVSLLHRTFQQLEFDEFEHVYQFIKFMLKIGLNLSRFELSDMLPAIPVHNRRRKYDNLKVIELLLKNEISIKQKEIQMNRLPENIISFLTSLGFINKLNCSERSYPPSLYSLCLRKVYTVKSIKTKGFPKRLLQFPEEDKI